MKQDRRTPRVGWARYISGAGPRRKSQATCARLAAAARIDGPDSSAPVTATHAHADKRIGGRVERNVNGAATIWFQLWNRGQAARLGASCLDGRTLVRPAVLTDPRDRAATRFVSRAPSRFGRPRMTNIEAFPRRPGSPAHRAAGRHLSRRAAQPRGRAGAARRHPGQQRRLRPRLGLSASRTISRRRSTAASSRSPPR